MKNLLQNKTHFQRRVALYVPSTTDVDKTVDNSEQVKRVLSEMSKMFGGATASDASGAWVTAAGDLVVEAVKIIYSYADAEAFEKYLDDVVTLAEQLKSEMRQESISLELDRELYFI